MSGKDTSQEDKDSGHSDDNDDTDGKVEAEEKYAADEDVAVKNINRKGDAHPPRDIVSEFESKRADKEASSARHQRLDDLMFGKV